MPQSVQAAVTKAPLIGWLEEQKFASHSSRDYKV